MPNIVATGSLSDLGYVEEVAYGVTPDAPQFIVFRRKSAAGLNLTKDSYDSEEIRSDRMVADSRHGTRRSGGDVETEVSTPAYIDHLEALMGNNQEAITTVMTAAGAGDLTIIANARIAGITGCGAIGNISTGMRVHLAGWTNPDNDGWATVITTIGAIGIYVMHDESQPIFINETAQTGNTVSAAGQFIRIGTSYRSFTFERAFTDIQKYQTYTGIRINSLAVTLPPTGLAGFTWNLVGKNASALSNSSLDTDAGAAVVKTNATWGLATFDADHGLSVATGDFTTSLTVGDTIVFDPMVETSGTDITEMVEKLYTVHVITSDDAVIFKEKVGSGTSATYTATITGNPNYTAADANSVMAAVSGALFLGDDYLTITQLAVVTDMNFTIDNQVGGSEVVGQNTVPFNLFGVSQSITGTLTVLFENETLYNFFEQEGEAIVVVRLDAPLVAGSSNFLQFCFPRCKFSSGNIGDAVSEGLPVEMEFRALRPDNVDALGTFTNTTPVVIQNYDGALV